jgi:hypothetical protein
LIGPAAIRLPVDCHCAPRKMCWTGAISLRNVTLVSDAGDLKTVLGDIDRLTADYAKLVELLDGAAQGVVSVFR